MRTRSIRNVKDLKNKLVFLRSDMNVPIKKGKVLDDFKIAASIETIKFLFRQNCRIVVSSHLEPVGGEKNASLKSVAKRLGELLGKKVKFVPDCLGEEAAKEVEKVAPGEILMLENLRMHKGEKENDPKFALGLAKLVDKSAGSKTKKIFRKLAGMASAGRGSEAHGVYVGDAFAVSHRKHASVSAIKKFLPAYAGLLIEKEIENLEKVIHPKKPAVAIIGGAKISTKIALIKSLLPKYDSILIGGAMANNFFAARGLEIGKSLASKEEIELARKLTDKKIVLPVDVIVSTGKEKGRVRHCRIDQVRKNEYIFDIGPETIRVFSRIIKGAKTLMWNGPMGKFENEHFSHGSLAIARLVGSRSSGKAFGVVGGGETMEVLEKSKMKEYIDWASSGGGAMLSYLGGEKMPGLEGIIGK